MIIAAAATGCGPSNGTDATAAPPSEEPLEAIGTPAPQGTTPPEPALPPPPATTDPATMVAAAPVRLRIPSIGVDSDLIGLGLQPDGTLEVPPDGFPAGWYTGAPTPGELGPAIIAGHVDWNGQPGVFFDLRDLAPGDDITITRHDGSTARFRVTAVEQFDKDAFPTQTVYGDLDHAGLRLITCAGAFDPTMRSYDDNLIVFAELVGSDPSAAP
jgi:sortase (surface protein transpeptidase)